MSNPSAVVVLDLEQSPLFFELQEKLPQYDRRAFSFVLGAIGYVVEKLEEQRHITGSELAHGILELARKAFGLLAPTVLEEWGVKRSEDLGEIVFALVEVGLIGSQESDRKEDFDNLFQVRQALEAQEYDWPGVKLLFESEEWNSSMPKFS